MSVAKKIHIKKPKVEWLNYLPMLLCGRIAYRYVEIIDKTIHLSTENDVTNLCKDCRKRYHGLISNAELEKKFAIW